MERDSTLNAIIQRVQGAKALRDLAEMNEAQPEKEKAIREMEQELLEDAKCLLLEELRS